MAPEVTVIIAARNAAETLGGTLAALAAQTVPPDRYEVIVVDDGSDDDTGRVAAAAGVKVLETGRHAGLPAARNLAIAEAAAPLIAFTDDDCLVDPDYVELGLARFRADPGATILACRTTIPLSGESGIPALLDAARHFDQEGYIADGYVAGGSMWVRTEAARRIGGLNEDLAKYGGEDYEFCRLLTSNGARIVYAPEVHQTHPPRRTLRALASKAWRLGRCFVAIRRYGRGPSPPAPLFARPWHLLPNPRVRGIERLRARGIEIGPARLAAMVLVQWVFLQLPFAIGELAAYLRRS